MALAEKAIERAQYDLDNSVVLAPFSGVVLEVEAEAGEYAATGTVVATLLDLSSLEVLANLPAKFVGALSPGKSVSAQTDTSDILDLTLRTILPTEFSNTRTRPALFGFSATDASLAVGQPITLAIPMGDTRDVVVVPKDALVSSRGGWTAFVNQDGTASPRTVEIGEAIGESFEVISGLNVGDEVVVRGNERLRPGQAILVAGAGGPPGAGRPGAAGPPGGASAPSQSAGPPDGSVESGGQPPSSYAASGQE
jgi:RND family efflux transporter MFP subunit